MTASTTLKKLATFVNPFALLRQQPEDRPLCVFSCKQGRYVVIAQDFTEIPFSAVRQQPLCRTLAPPQALPFTRGLVGVVSYDQFAKRPSPVAARFFAVDSALIFDLHTATVWQSGVTSQPLSISSAPKPPLRAICLTPAESDADYLATVRKIITDIRNGRYYLLNFLRFFSVSPCTHHELLVRLEHSNAPWRAVMRQHDFALYSFSPERFVTLRRQDGHTQLTCTPIKGTAARSRDPCTDRQARAALQHSTKDLAELHITIDLARNDINRIAQPGSTQVSCAAQVQSFASVHHLVGTITARLRDDVTLGEFLHALCPAASISGAPKTEVMRAIASYEARARGFCMGNIFCLDVSGQLDSSVLIRTVVNSQHGAIYAAGGGIVLESNPEQECHEIQTKLQCLLATSKHSLTPSRKNK